MYLVLMLLRVVYTLVEILLITFLTTTDRIHQYVHINTRFSQLRSKIFNYYLDTSFVRQSRGQSVAGQRYHVFGLGKRVKGKGVYIIAQFAFNLAIIDRSVQISL